MLLHDTAIYGPTFASIYTQALNKLVKEPEYICTPRGIQIKERTNQTLILCDPYSNLFESDVRPFPKKYLAGEILWYFSGDNSLEFISQYSKFWKNIANLDNTLNSAYGNLIFTKKNQYGICEWEWAIKSLLNDKDSRQAIMSFNRPEHHYPDNKDQVCTIFNQFMIRDNKLNLHVTMRSNDIIKGTTFDIPFFSLLQINAFNILKLKYPELQMGFLYHNVMSLHLYEKDFELAEKMIKNNITEAKIPINNEIIVNDNGECCKELISIKNNKYSTGSYSSFFYWLLANK